MHMMEIGHCKLILKQGDITKEEADVIVNAANSSILGGGGVDGAIHRAAGPALIQACLNLRKQQEESGSFIGCDVGQAVITEAGNLHAKHVVHTVGPDRRVIAANESAGLLKSAYEQSLELAAKVKAESVVFPSISTGIYSYPIEEASKIALETTAAFLKKPSSLGEVRFVLYSDQDFKVYQAALQQLRGTPA